MKRFNTKSKMVAPNGFVRYNAGKSMCYSAIHSLSSGSLIENTINTLIKVFSGLILASVIAIHLGILIGRNQTLEELTSFVISILRLFPPVAWIPFSILWFGIGSVPAVFIIFMGCVSLF